MVFTVNRRQYIHFTKKHFVLFSLYFLFGPTSQFILDDFLLLKIICFHTSMNLLMPLSLLIHDCRISLYVSSDMFLRSFSKSSALTSKSIPSLVHVQAKVNSQWLTWGIITSSKIIVMANYLIFSQKSHFAHLEWIGSASVLDFKINHHFLECALNRLTLIYRLCKTISTTLLMKHTYWILFFLMPGEIWINLLQYFGYSGSFEFLDVWVKSPYSWLVRTPLS